MIPSITKVRNGFDDHFEEAQTKRKGNATLDAVGFVHQQFDLG